MNAEPPVTSFAGDTALVMRHPDYRSDFIIVMLGKCPIASGQLRRTVTDAILTDLGNPQVGQRI